MNTLLCLAVMLFTGLLFGRLAKLCRLPNVTGYLIGGLLIGPGVLGLIPGDTLKEMSLISETALGFIAFTIGAEFKITYFKKVGKAPVVIAVAESLLAVVFVVAGLLVAGFPLDFSLALGSIAAATAPAATIMVIRQYCAKGPVTDTLLSVVAIDDATALIMFGISIAIAQAFSGAAVSFGKIALSLSVEIIGALIAGAVLAVLFLLPLRFFKKEGNRLSVTVGFVFAGVGIATLCGFSSLLLCMAMGAVLCNLTEQSGQIMKITDSVTPPILLLFFVASGADLQLSAIASIGVAGVLYIILRVVGKMAGASLGAVISGADAKVKKYLGPALIPQAGVAIGLSLAAMAALPEYGMQIRTVILCATLIYELVGPAITKLSLKKSGEITG